MKHFLKILSIALLFISMHGYAQKDTSLQLLKTFNTDIIDLAVDNLDNIYILSSTDQLKKFNAKGDSVGVYNQVKKYGKLYSIDASNPLKLLLFYKDFSTVVVLDRLLSVRTALDLRRYNMIQTSAIGLSYDNNIWVFDAFANKLKKVDEEGKLLMETADFRMLFPKSIQPQQIIDQNKRLYLYDSTSGVYVFDYYGTFQKKLPITAWKNISVVDKYIFGLTGTNTINLYNTSTLLSAQKLLPIISKSAYNYHIANNKLFAWTKDTLNIYTYPF